MEALTTTRASLFVSLLCRPRHSLTSYMRIFKSPGESPVSARLGGGRSAAALGEVDAAEIGIGGLRYGCLCLWRQAARPRWGLLSKPPVVGHHN